jgi:hypothetical protein
MIVSTTVMDKVYCDYRFRKDVLGVMLMVDLGYGGSRVCQVIVI